MLIHIGADRQPCRRVLPICSCDGDTGIGTAELVRFLVKFALALVLPAFVPAEPFPPLVTVTYTADIAKAD